MGHPFDVRGEQRELVNVLERAASLEQVAGGAADENEGRLGHLGVFDGGNRVGEPRAGRDDGHAGNAGGARHGVGGKGGRHLVAHVDHADAHLLGPGQNGRNVAAGEREDHLDPVLLARPSATTGEREKRREKKKKKKTKEKKKRKMQPHLEHVGGDEASVGRVVDPGNGFQHLSLEQQTGNVAPNAAKLPHEEQRPGRRQQHLGPRRHAPG